MKTIEVNVTQEHINMGLRRSIVSCPIALALRDVGFNGMIGSKSFYTIGSYKELALPAQAVDFIDNFDHDCEVHPFSFYVTI